ncbi:hypothetical protein L7F22_068500 [Adiantum nelumboides]|nr:hypothetical protein [Adiantum nelumboides]
MTRWVEAQSVARVNEKTVSKFIYTHIYCRFGTPLEIVSNNGPGFRRGLLIDVCDELKISHKHSTPYYPQSNGLVEKANGIIADIIRKMVESKPKRWDNFLDGAIWAYRTTYRDATQYYPQSNGLVEKANGIIADIIRKMVESKPKRWDNFLDGAIWAYRTTYRDATQFTPFHLVYGQEALQPIELNTPTIKLTGRQEQNNDEAWIDRLLSLVELEWKREAAYHCYERKALQLKDKLNEGLKDKEIKEKILVLRYNNALDNRFDAKFERRWEGPFIVKKAFIGGYYQLMDLNGKEHPRKVNGYWLKPYLSHILPAVFETKQVSKKTKKDVAHTQLQDRHLTVPALEEKSPLKSQHEDLKSKNSNEQKKNSAAKRRGQSPLGEAKARKKTIDTREKSLVYDVDSPTTFDSDVHSRRRRRSPSASPPYGRRSSRSPSSCGLEESEKRVEKKRRNKKPSNSPPSQSSPKTQSSSSLDSNSSYACKIKGHQRMHAA